MNITSLKLHNFRCFPEATYSLEAPIVIIEGQNGTGKSSLLEALHYACYLKSFRTHVLRDMITLQEDSIAATALCINLEGITHNEPWSLRIGFSGNKRSIKVNNAVPHSYKDIVSFYKVISILESDLYFINGSPEDRRTTLDNALLITHPETAALFKRYRAVLEQRNAYLQKDMADKTLHQVITEQLWQSASLICKHRISMLEQLNDLLYTLLQRLDLPQLKNSSVMLSYIPKKELGPSVERFIAQSQELFLHERLLKRTLFGPHLDDIGIMFQGRLSKTYASRGQQKLILCLFKLAQCLINTQGTIVLLDDIFTDFDEKTVRQLIPLIFSIASQVFITVPLKNPILADILNNREKNYQTIYLSE